MSVANELIEKLDKLHTTELGVVRIKRNLSLDVDDVVEWCRDKIKSDNAVITRNGKNWYINIDASIITVNAYSYTIITAHKEKIEDEYDLNAFDKAMASFKQDGTTYTLDEVEKELGLV